MSSPAALTKIPLFLVALLVVRAVPAILYARLIGKRGAIAAGLMQATTLTFVIVAAQLGVATGQLSPTASASLLAAGLLSATIFPGPPSNCSAPRHPRRSTPNSNPHLITPAGRTGTPAGTEATTRYRPKMTSASMLYGIAVCPCAGGCL